jgi:prepilin signal peptidase PulO-like enzyme (type II secretory pathway)
MGCYSIHVYLQLGIKSFVCVPVFNPTIFQTNMMYQTEPLSIMITLPMNVTRVKVTMAIAAPMPMTTTMKMMMTTMMVMLIVPEWRLMLI